MLLLLLLGFILLQLQAAEQGPALRSVGKGREGWKRASIPCVAECRITDHPRSRQPPALSTAQELLTLLHAFGFWESLWDESPGRAEPAPARRAALPGRSCCQQGNPATDSHECGWAGGWGQP